MARQCLGERKGAVADSLRKLLDEVGVGQEILASAIGLSKGAVRGDGRLDKEKHLQHFICPHKERDFGGSLRMVRAMCRFPFSTKCVLHGRKTDLF